MASDKFDRVTISLPRDLIQALDARAAECKRTRSNMVRILLEEEMTRKNVREILREDGET